MIESKRSLLVGEPKNQLAHWITQVEKAKIKRSRYQDQEAEGLMTREEFRSKLSELDETIRVAEAEIEKLRHHEEHIRAIEEAGEGLIERYAKLVPEALDDLPPI